jgi:sortase A
MRIVVTRESLRWILRWTQIALFGVAISTLGYCGFVLEDTWVFQHEERRQLDQLLAARPEAAYPTSPRRSPPAENGDLIGLIEIPRLGVSAIVIEGTSGAILRRAAGHISGTALPGQPGNVGIAGHRDTFFLPLQNIRTNDTITFKTLFGEYRYRVVSTRVVSPTDVAVLKRSGNEILTLVTCYPFDFVGAAPDRFIVRAERIT